MNDDANFFRAHPTVDIAVDFNNVVSDELLVRLCDVREGVSPHPGDVLVAGDWDAKPAKVQVLEVTTSAVRLRVLS
jgi:hypothetical protein